MRKEKLRAANAENFGELCLNFDSLFESGNLARAQFIREDEYKLFMQSDTNTKGHQQWFYFRVTNTRKDMKYKFHVLNFTKPVCLFRNGMRVWIKSKKS